MRHRILGFVCALILLSLFGSTVSLYRITEVNRSLDSINRVSVPLGKLFAQMQVDADVFRRELNRGLGYSHCKDPYWNARPVPRWIVDVIESEVERAQKLIQQDPSANREEWEHWAADISKNFGTLKERAARLYLALEQKDQATAEKLYPEWTVSLDEWIKQLQWGVTEHEQVLRGTFTEAQSRVAELRTGLEVILLVVVSLSLLMLWFGEKALRPLGELTRLAREITRRGLKKEDKTLLPKITLSRNDEVSQLAREFYNMATALLEREKVVETQKKSLEDQNRLLREMGELQIRLERAEHLAAVGRMSAQVAHEVRNPLHSIGLEAEMAAEQAAKIGHLSLKQSLQSILASVDRLEKITENYLKLSRLSAGEKTFFNLGDALESVLATYAPAFQEQGVTVDWSRRPGACLGVQGDRDLIEQGLGNLFRNSLQALQDQPAPRVVFTLGDTESGRVWLRIEDNGPGIAPEIREKLFTPYLTTRAQGTGLGLSFIKKILEDHGGTISWIASPKGACFEVLLPMAQASEIHTERKENSLHV